MLTEYYLGEGSLDLSCLRSFYLLAGFNLKNPLPRFPSCHRVEWQLHCLSSLAVSSIPLCLGMHGMVQQPVKDLSLIICKLGTRLKFVVQDSCGRRLSTSGTGPGQRVCLGVWGCIPVTSPWQLQGLGSWHGVGEGLSSLFLSQSLPSGCPSH